MFVSVARLDPGLNAWLDATEVTAEGTTQVVLRGAGWQRAFVVRTPQVNTMVLVSHALHPDLASSERPVTETAALLAATPRHRRSWPRILAWTAIALLWIAVLVAGVMVLTTDVTR